MARILVTGSGGLVGEAVRRASESRPQHAFLFSARQGVWAADLTSQEDVAQVFKIACPDYVIHTAAFVGGVNQQVVAPYDLVQQNLLMNCNVIEQCIKHKVKKLLAFSSVCAMPDTYDPDDGHPQPPLNEYGLHHGAPPQPNWHYGYAKRMVDVLIDGAMKQHGVKNWCSVIPVNIYGPNDNHRLGVCHVVPALIHKLYNAKKSGSPLSVWGTGSAVREFLYVDDLARVLLRLLDLDEIPQRLIVSPSVPTTVRELVKTLVAECYPDLYKIEWDSSKPDGQHARPTDTSLLKSLLFKEVVFSFDKFWTPLADGLRKSYEWFGNNYNEARK